MMELQVHKHNDSRVARKKRHMGNLFSKIAKFYTKINVIAHFPGSCRDTHAVKDVKFFQLRRSTENPIYGSLLGAILRLSSNQ